MTICISLPCICTSATRDAVSPVSLRNLCMRHTVIPCRQMLCAGQTSMRAGQTPQYKGRLACMSSRPWSLYVDSLPLNWSVIFTLSPCIGTRRAQQRGMILPQNYSQGKEQAPRRPGRAPPMLPALGSSMQSLHCPLNQGRQHAPWR